LDYKYLSMDNKGLEWISYDKREDWKDVIPIFQTEHERSVATIAYSEKCKLLMYVCSIT